MFSAKKTLAEAWKITQQNKRHLFWYGFLPSFFAIVVGVLIVIIQIILVKNSSFFLESTEKAMSIFDIMRPVWHWIMSPEVPTQAAITTIILVFLLAYILPVFCEGAIILMTKNRNENDEMGSGFGKGMSCFLPMFEFSLMQGTIKPYSMFLEFLFIARILGKESVPFLKPLFFIIVILGSIALFFFTFVAQFIALKKEKMGDATLSSLKFVSRFFTETMKVLVLFIFIELRTLFNVLVVFLLPFVLFSMGGIIAEGIFGLIAQVIVGLIILSLAASISGVLFVYKNVAWTLVFLKLQEIKAREDADE